MRHVFAVLAALSFISATSLSRPCNAQMLSGSFTGYAIVDFVHVVDFQVVDEVFTYAPATLSFSFGIDNNPFPIGREPYVNFISISDPDYSRSIIPGYDGPYDSTVNITDGIPGTSADTAFASTDVYIIPSASLAETFPLCR
jgi:hypothetical protein